MECKLELTAVRLCAARTDRVTQERCGCSDSASAASCDSLKWNRGKRIVRLGVDLFVDWLLLDIGTGML
jgi:hypothetical protein